MRHNCGLCSWRFLPHSYRTGTSRDTLACTTRKPYSRGVCRHHLSDSLSGTSTSPRAKVFSKSSKRWGGKFVARRCVLWDNQSKIPLPKSKKTGAGLWPQALSASGWGRAAPPPLAETCVTVGNYKVAEGRMRGRRGETVLEQRASLPFPLSTFSCSPFYPPKADFG